MPDNSLPMPPLTSAKAVMECLHPASLDRIEIGPLYLPQENALKPGSTGDVTHFARTSAKTVVINSTAYEELLQAKQQLKRERRK